MDTSGFVPKGNLNTDQNATPWMNPALGEDVTEAVKAALR